MQPHPHGIMADGKDFSDFMQGGVRVFVDVGPQLGRIEFAPAAPAGLGREGVRFGGGEVAVDGAFAQRETPGRLGARAAGGGKFHHPFSQIQRIGFHVPNLPPVLPM